MIASPDLVVAVASADYLPGVGVLFNSLHRRGFRGVFAVAARGPRPRWWPDSPDGSVTGGGRLVWMELPPEGVPAVWKPWAIRQARARWSPDGRWFYADADLVVKAPWTWFQNWVGGGLAAVEDLFGGGHMADAHPWRRHWAGWLREQGAEIRRPGGSYVNSGFLGGLPEHAEVLVRWERWLWALGQAGVPRDRLRVDTSDPRRWSGPGAGFLDQDALNLALMTGDEPLAAMEPSAMDFGSGGEVLSHAAYMDKPWAMRPWAAAWRGTPPAEAQRWYWREAHGVLPVWTEAELRRWRKDLAEAYAWTQWPLGLKYLPAAVEGWWRERRRT